MFLLPSFRFCLRLSVLWLLSLRSLLLSLWLLNSLLRLSLWLTLRFLSLRSLLLSLWLLNFLLRLSLWLMLLNLRSLLILLLPLLS